LLFSLQILTPDKEGTMKRILGLLALAALLITPSLAFAEQIGVYVTPKFVIGFTQMQGMKGNGTFDARPDGGELWPFSYKVGNKTDNAFGGALAVGYDFNKKFQVPVRAELEYAVFSEVSGKKSWNGPHPNSGGWVDPNYSAKQKLQIQTLFVNAYYDFRNSTPLTPWVGAGLGMAFIDSKGSLTVEFPVPGDDIALSLGSKTSTNFAWNIGAGVAYDFTDYISLDLGYRFVGFGKAETKSASDNAGLNIWTAKAKTRDVYMHQVMLGLRFTF